MELVFGRVGFEREILGVKEEGRGVSWYRMLVCVCGGRCVVGFEFRLRGGGLGWVSGRAVECDGLPFLVLAGCEGFFGWVFVMMGGLDVIFKYKSR